MSNLEPFFELSSSQKRIWYNEQIYGQSCINNIGGGQLIYGNVEIQLLERAISHFIKQNDGIRLQIVNENGSLKQWVRPYKEQPFDFIDFRKHADPEGDYSKWSKKQMSVRFQMEDSQLFYFALFKLSDDCSGFLGKFHHLIADGWSITLLINSILSNYHDLKNGRRLDILQQEQYRVFVEEEESYICSKRYEWDKEFWNTKFKHLVEPISSSNLDADLKGARKSYSISSITTKAIQHFINQQKYSISEFFISVTALFFSRFYGKKEIVLGIPVAGRTKNSKRLFGMCTSVIPLRISLEDTFTLLELMNLVKKEMYLCLKHYKYPYERLHHDLKLRSRNQDGLYQITFNYYNTRPNTEMGDTKLVTDEYYPGEQPYILQILVKQWSENNNITLNFDYLTGLFDEHNISQFYECYLHLIYQFIRNPYEKLSKISVVSEKMKDELIYGYNCMSTKCLMHKTIVDLFEDQVKKQPDAIAVSHKDDYITYADLHKKVDMLSQHIIGKNHEKGIVGIIGYHSIDLVVGILAILKSGSAFLPLDNKHPGNRNAYMLKDAKVSLLLTNIDTSFYSDVVEDIIRIDDERSYQNTPDIPVECNPVPSDLAYVIYTSGSTGNPKGVLVEHKNLVNYINWACNTYIKGKDDIFAFYSSIAFDLTVTSLFVPIVSGVMIRVYSNDENEYVLRRIINENIVTILKLTPAHLSLIKEYNLSKSVLKTLILGGENLKTKDAAFISGMLDGKADIYNEYGPTEATVGCMIYKYSQSLDKGVYVPIGAPIDNTNLYVLDETLNLLPPGSVGELYISGVGVTRGYLNQIELTESKFLPDPWVKEARMYKTADLVKLSANGCMECIGRADRQIKIRGFRIETGEIEQQLLALEGVKNAVVISSEIEGEKELCAYVVFDEPDNIEISKKLLQILPSYMVPKYIIPLKELPLTINGKIEIDLLPSPTEEGMSQYEDYCEEEPDIQAEVLSAVKTVFGVETISGEDNFFNLGGDSIKAIQLAGLLNSVGIRLKVEDILTKPVIRHMTAYCKRRYISNEIESVTGEVPMIPIITQFVTSNYTRPDYYNQSVLLTVKETVEAQVMEDYLHKIIEQQDSFRLNYDPVSKKLFYNPEVTYKDFKLSVYDLKKTTDIELRNTIAKLGESLKAGFDISNDLLIRAILIKTENYNDYLLITAHHLCIDGVSWRIILTDLNSLLTGNISNGKRLGLVKTSSYKAWANSIQMQKEERFMLEYEYWQKVMNTYANFNIPDTDAFEGAEKNVDITFSLPEDKSYLIKEKVISFFNVKTDELLQIVFALVLREFYQSNWVAYMIESHGREVFSDAVDVSKTVGWFTSIYPAVFHIADDDFNKTVRVIKESLRQVPSRGIGFGILAKTIKQFEAPMGKEIVFNYLGDLDDFFKNSIFQFSDIYSGDDISDQNILQAAMELNCIYVNKQLSFNIICNSRYFDDNSIRSFKALILNTIDCMITYVNKSEVEFSPSDFDLVDLSEEELKAILS